MSDSYTKLFSSITTSTVWGEPHETRLVWITMLASVNRSGEVFGSVPGLAHEARVSLEGCIEALKKFMEPDPWSRTKDFEGRRIREIDGGWLLLNHAKFDKMRSEIEAKERRRESQRAYDQRVRNNRKRADYREDAGLFTPDVPPTKSDNIRRDPTKTVHPPAVTTEQDQKLLESSLRSDSAPMMKKGKGNKVSRAERLRQITPEAIAAYNAILGKPHGLLASIRPGVGLKIRTKQVARCAEVASDVCRTVYGSKAITADFWKAYFDSCSEDPFLSGQVKGGEGHANWKPDFEYLTRPAVMLKTFEKAMAEAEE